MTKLFFLLSFYFLVNFNFSQNNHQVYTFSVTHSFLSAEYELVVFDNFSYWHQTNNAVVNNAAPVNKKPKQSTAKLYKDYRTENIYSGYSVLGNKYALKDSLNLMNWELKEEFEEILGYKCQAATTEFRGREYKAFFTPELPFSEGPFKFNGLPGMILKVENKNPKRKENINTVDQYSWECIGINTSVETEENLYNEQKKYINECNEEIELNWEQLKEKVEASVAESKKAMRTKLKSSSGSGLEITYSMENFPEIIHEELQTTGLKIKL